MLITFVVNISFHLFYFCNISFTNNYRWNIHFRNRIHKKVHRSNLRVTFVRTLGHLQGSPYIEPLEFSCPLYTVDRAGASPPINVSTMSAWMSLGANPSSADIWFCRIVSIFTKCLYFYFSKSWITYPVWVYLEGNNTVSIRKGWI